MGLILNYKWQKCQLWRAGMSPVSHVQLKVVSLWLFINMINS